MVDISSSDIRRIDPASLMVFLALMRHRKGTLAARDLGLTQPAISHALKRMREVYQDPLFLRRSHGLEPTALARELEPKIRGVVDLLAQTLSPKAEFDPGEVTAELRLGAFDFELATILPALVASLRTRAPGVSIVSYQIPSEQAPNALLDGRIDMVIGYFADSVSGNPSFITTPLYSERYVAVARKSHPLFAGAFSFEAFAKSDHLLVSPSGPKRNMVDHALQLAGLSRTVKTVVPSLFSALTVLGQTDLIASVPARVAIQHADRFGLAYRELPMEGGQFQLHAITHVRDQRSAMHQWMVNEIKAASQVATPDCD
ncbi:MAG: LysR family transcriptional regulator [Pseudomonadota bacterium]